MLPTQCLGASITVATNTSTPFSKRKQTPANCQISNPRISIAMAGHNRQTSFQYLTTGSSKDLSTGGWPCVNSGGGKHSHYLSRACNEQIKDNGDDGHITPTSDNANNLQKFGQEAINCEPH